MVIPIKYNKALNSIAFIGNYPPRQCGIATFTADLLESVVKETDPERCSAVVMNDLPEGYDYPPPVGFEINQKRLADYRRASEFLNMKYVDVVCLQHEYGIFGGPAGSNIIQLLNNLTMPVVTTLHTVLKTPTPEQFDVMRQIVNLSSRLVVMSEKACEFLATVYQVPKQKIVFIHHGIPDIPFIDPNYYKDKFGVEGRKVILTFGLLSQNKGIEYMIQALPQVTKKHPDAVYIILGATHPHVIRTDGEGYRIELQQMAKKLGVADNVIFHDRFVTLEELSEFLGAADVYVTPYVSEVQITSGTLLYALGAGKATVSTPYWYATEMLSENRGIIVPFKNPDALAKEVSGLLNSDIERNAMRKRAYLFCRPAVWKEVARQYLEVFMDVKEERSSKPKNIFYLKNPRKEIPFELPDINLQHLQVLTDDTSIFQHAIYSIPNRMHGYCTDDNARALMVSIVTTRHMVADDQLVSKLTRTYLSFLQFAYNPETGRFRNFMTYDRRWLEEQGSEDSHGRAVWSLGVAVSYTDDPGIMSMCVKLFNDAIKAVEHFSSPRALAFSLIGIHAYLSRYPGDTDVKRIRANLAACIYDAFKNSRTDEWPWPEEMLSYANSRLPHALILSGQWLNNASMLSLGLDVLTWLYEIQFVDGHFVPIGSNGWYSKGGTRARFDQQPIEAHAMIDACIEAYNATQEQKWIDRAVICFNWFLGSNDLGLPLYNSRTKGCRDGLTPDGANQNEGAESTLAWLLSLTALHKLDAENILKIPISQKDNARAVPDSASPRN